MPALKLRINGIERDVNAQEQTSLLEVLRDQLELTGAKYGCGEGQCGACTVLVAGKPVKSCITAASQVAAQPIETIEGLAADGRLHPLQEAFLAKAAFQCGYCTPGMILGAKALLDEIPAPTPQQIKLRLEGHVCRCGTYARIVEAVEAAAVAIRAGVPRDSGGHRA